MTYSKRARTTTRRRIRVRRARAAGLLVVIAAIAAALGHELLASSSSTAASPLDVSSALREALPSTVWPADGQAAFISGGQSQIQAGPNQHAAAIASVAKVMTAYLVLRDHPLGLGQDGPMIALTDDDVADTDRRRGQEESVVSIAAGEQLTERQALQALLLPSANNIAAVLARWDAGSVERFVALMNAAARSLGMTHTRYTDPSGYDDADRVHRRRPGAHRRSGHAAVGVREHRRQTERDAAGRRHRAQHQYIARARRLRRRQDGLRTTQPAAASPSAPSAGSTASGRRSPGSCWASPATTGSRRVSRPPPPWSTASPVAHSAGFGLRRPSHHDDACQVCSGAPSSLGCGDRRCVRTTSR